jgi:FXSXX-COOH protein
MGDDADLESELLDVTGIDLDQLDALPSSALRTALSRVLTEQKDIPDRYSGFQNSLQHDSVHTGDNPGSR